MKLIQLLEDPIKYIDPEDIKIENGVMILNQFPNIVRNFDCHFLYELTSLKNCPQKITESFFCYNTGITSLEYAPKIIGSTFGCSATKIVSLDYAPLECEKFDCAENNILHLKGIGRSYLKKCVELELTDTIKSNILGLCRIKNLETITIDVDNSHPLYEAIQIVKKYLQTDGSDCAEELMQNGFNDYAKF
jgi:hypothetical protein